MQITLSARSAAGRINGKLGGLKTATTHSKEFLEQRASKAGSTTRDRYGRDYYRYIRKARKQTINPTLRPAKYISSVQLMQEATKSLMN